MSDHIQSLLSTAGKNLILMTYPGVVSVECSPENNTEEELAKGIIHVTIGFKPPIPVIVLDSKEHKEHDDKVRGNATT